MAAFYFIFTFSFWFSTRNKKFFIWGKCASRRFIFGWTEINFLLRKRKLKYQKIINNKLLFMYGEMEIEIKGRRVFLGSFLWKICGWLFDGWKCEMREIRRFFSLIFSAFWLIKTSHLHFVEFLFPLVK